eukprot:Clim_evm33s241 gene=Clim_evmTU33s241
MSLAGVYRYALRHSRRAIVYGTSQRLFAPFVTSAARCSGASVPKQGTIDIDGKAFELDDYANVTDRVLSKVGWNLHQDENHPIGIVRSRIFSYFTDADGYAKDSDFPPPSNVLDSASGTGFAAFSDYHPVVTVQQNFDSLLFPSDHEARSRHDNYYVNRNQLFRAHCTAHQADLLRSGHHAWVLAGDVYRRDEIDASHYPVFHQVDAQRALTEDEIRASGKLADGVAVFDPSVVHSDLNQAGVTPEATSLVVEDMKRSLEGACRRVFGKDTEMRWIDAYFPFTHPSFELEIQFGGEWLEVLGCGVTRQDIMAAAGVPDRVAWAFGLGIERWAMIRYAVPDIRLFWSRDERFLSQFSAEKAAKDLPERYQPFSNHSPALRDIAFWLPEGDSGDNQAQSGGFSDNTFFDLVRGLHGDVVEKVELIDDFKHPKTSRRSKCFRITYRSFERTFWGEEVNVMHEQVMEEAAEQLGVELRVK